MQDQVRSTTEELQKRLGTMTKKQDDLMESQKQMDDTLKRVENNVGEVSRRHTSICLGFTDVVVVCMGTTVQHVQGAAEGACII